MHICTCFHPEKIFREIIHALDHFFFLGKFRVGLTVDTVHLILIMRVLQSGALPKGKKKRKYSHSVHESPLLKKRLLTSGLFLMGEII